MGRLEDARYAGRLAAAEDVAAPHLVRLGLEGGVGSWAEDVRLGAVTAGVLAAISDQDVPAVRIVMLRRIADSDLGAARSAHGMVRAALARRALPVAPEDAALELALCRSAIDLGYGIALSWMRLPLLDPMLEDLDRIAPTSGTPELIDEAECLVDVLANETLAMDGGSAPRRLRLLAFLTRMRPPGIPADTYDGADAYGAAMTALVASDRELASGAASLLGLAVRADKALPDARQIRAIADLTDLPRPGLADAVRRSLGQLLTAPLVVRGPGSVTIRPSNQRLARAALWLVPAVLRDVAPDLLGDVALRMATSGKRDNQARDVALAGTCIDLLVTLDDERSAAALARLQVRVRNRTVQKHVARALEVVAERAGGSVEDLVEAALPGHGLDPDGRRAWYIGAWTAEARIGRDARIVTTWHGPAEEVVPTPPIEVSDAHMDVVAEIGTEIRALGLSLADERLRIDRAFAEERRWPFGQWHVRYLEHPLRKVLARHLIWRLSSGSRLVDVSPDGSTLVGVDGRPIAPTDDMTVTLWHPIEVDAEVVERWRTVLAEQGIVQPVQQVTRATYLPPADQEVLLDRRFADRPVAYGQMRALLGARGWAVPMLGPWDGGDRSIARRDLPSAGLRAEFVHIPAGVGDRQERVRYARSGSVRFVGLDDPDRIPLPLATVSRRAFSEVMRDIDLCTSISDPLRSSAAGSAPPSTAARASALRKLLPELAIGHRLTVVGSVLRVEGPADTWAISLSTGAVSQLPGETPVVPPALVPQDPDQSDDLLLGRVLATAAWLLRADEAPRVTGRPRGRPRQDRGQQRLRAFPVQWPVVQGADDAVRVEQVVGRESVAPPGVEDRRGAVEGDRVGQVVGVDVAPDLVW